MHAVKAPLKSFALLLYLSSTILSFSPVAILSIIGLMLMRSLTSGIGLLLVIPILHLIGISTLGHSDSTAHSMTSMLRYAHIPLQLSSLLGVFVLVMIGLASMHFLEDIVSSKWQDRYQSHLREKIYQAILRTRWDYFDGIKRDEFLHGITAQLQTMLHCIIQLFQLVSQLILVGVYVALSCLVSWQMTLMASGIALLLLSIMLPLHRMIAQSSRLLLQRHQMLFHLFYEQFSALKMIKSCRAESVCVLNMMTESRASDYQTQRTTMIRAVSKWCYAAGTAVAFSLVLYVAIEIVHLPLDTLVLLLLVFARLMPKISSLQQSYQVILRFLPVCESLKRLFEDCLAHQEHAGDSHAVISMQHAIVLKNISYHHHHKPVVERFSMVIQKNTTTLLCGPSGVGKTTLADMIAGLFLPTSGTIQIDATCLDDITMLAWRKSVAYVMQDAHLFNTSIRDNLRLFAPDVNEEDIWSALSLVSAKVFVSKLAQGLDTVVGDRGTHLSGGERQRIALARALLMKPQLLILDESTNALDQGTIEVIQQALFALRGKMTILMISHQPEMRHYADQVIHMQSVKSPMSCKSRPNYTLGKIV